MRSDASFPLRLAITAELFEEIVVLPACQF